MIVQVKSGERVAVTKHAVQRYRQRVDRSARQKEIKAAIAEGVVRTRPPSWGTLRSAMEGESDGWLHARGWALVLRRPNDTDGNRDRIDFVAATCIAKHTRSKADRRQLREQAREDRWAA